MAAILIIDYRACNDEAAGGDIHLRHHSFSLRERLHMANGRSDDKVMVVEAICYGLYGNNSPLMQNMILALDRWITAVRADARDCPQIDKVVQNKPADLQEGCHTHTANPSFISQAQVRDAATRREGLHPSNSFPREVAGAAAAADGVKCQTTPLSAADFAAPITAVQWAPLQAAFPAGVCDGSRVGVEQQPLAGTGQRF